MANTHTHIHLRTPKLLNKFLRSRFGVLVFLLVGKVVRVKVAFDLFLLSVCLSVGGEGIHTVLMTLVKWFSNVDDIDACR